MELNEEAVKGVLIAFKKENPHDFYLMIGFLAYALKDKSDLDKILEEI